MTDVWRSDQHHAASLEKRLSTFGLAGAMKVPHAVAMHAIQVRAALTWLLGVAVMGKRRRLGLVLAATVGHVAPAVSLLQTAAGLAPLDLVVARRRAGRQHQGNANGAARFRRGHRHAHDLQCAMSREPELLADVERREKRCGGSSALASSADTCPLRSCRNVTAGFTTMPGGLPAHETASRRNRV